MPLTTTANVLLELGIENATDPVVMSRYDLYRKQAEAAVKAWVNWDLESVVGQTDFYDGNGYFDIHLRSPYVNGITSVNVDSTGAYGSGPSPFSAATLLTQGTDYALVRDKGSTGKSGLLRKISGSSPLWFPSDLVFFRDAGGLGYRRPNYWPAGFGNVKVVYDYGFVTIPDDIVLAVVTATSMISNSVKYGYPLTGEGLADYNYNVAIARDPEFGTVRQLLGKYRDVSL